MRVLHLVGSAVSDFYADLSRLYAADCLAATADPARYEFHIAHVSPDGAWRFPAELSDSALAEAPAMPIAAAVERLVALDPDVAVPQMFCLPGMTAYRSLLEVLRVRYVGNRPDVMAIGAQKARAKAVVGAAGVAVPDGVLVGRRDGVPADVALPAVVKPVDADNSLGISLVRERTELAPALDAAFEHSPHALVERYVELGREVRCGVVERGGDLVCLPLEEYAVDAVAKPIRDHADKIRPGDGGRGLGLVAKDAEHAWIVDPDDPVNAAVGELARRAHVALGCRHYSLFDVRVDRGGQPWFLEASLYCSFARQSVLAVMAAAAGMPLDVLFASAVELALAG